MSSAADRPRTCRIGARGSRAELFAGGCLAQQKLEILQRSAQAREGPHAERAERAPGAADLEELRLASGEPLVAPAVLLPALLTEDMVLQLDAAAASISEAAERAELYGREVRGDAAAFKAANPSALLEDFVMWRTRSLGLSMELFPREWLQQVWEAVTPKPANVQSSRLFEPEREAEMALHYLENMEGTQLLLQVFRSRLSAALEELSELVDAEGRDDAVPVCLRVLRDRAVAAAVRAFTGDFGEGGSPPQEDVCDTAVDAENIFMDEVDDFPSDGSLEAALQAVEAFEAAARLSVSLRAKFGAAGTSLVEDLMSEGEASVTSPAQRRILEDIFARSKVLAQTSGRELPDGREVFESLPQAKEFVLCYRSPDDRAGLPATRRLYAELRERQMRLATAWGFRMT